jgi:uncharacterized membrane protein YfcA
VDPLLLLAAVGIGVVVGLTGMGGGALMTPVLVLGFGIPPLTAVSSDLVASAFMKPAGSWVHIRRKTVNWDLVKYLVIGSVPAAFLGVLSLRFLGDDAVIQGYIRTALGVALLVAASGLGVRAYFRLRERAANRDGSAKPLPQNRPEVLARPIPTIVVGIIGGFMVGLTSVGSGSIMIIAMMALYPTLKAAQLVGTDLVQAVPLVLTAAVAHLFFGDVDWSVALPVILGSIPGAYVGARLSSRASGGLVRRALALILLASGLKLLGVETVTAVWTVVGALVGGTLTWAWIRHQLGFSFFVWQERRGVAKAQRVRSDPPDAGDAP